MNDNLTENQSNEAQSPNDAKPVLAVVAHREY